MKPTVGEVIASAVLLALASVSCSVQPQASAAAPIPPTAASATLLMDDFSSMSSGWDTGDYGAGSVQYAYGGLQMKAVKAGDLTWSNPNTAAYEHVHVEVTAINRGDPQAAFGILCNQQPSAGSYYYLAIRPDGEYEIGKSVMGQQDMLLTGGGKWAATDLIPKNAGSYRLGADCGPGTLTLYVNGRTIDSVRDSAFIKGEVGLFLSTAQTAAGDVLYDDFTLTRLP